jgi:hypothetical protein
MGFYIEDHDRQSSPVSETGMQAFKCYLTAKQIWTYITVQRQGSSLVYNCFRDEDVRLKLLANKKYN